LRRDVRMRKAPADLGDLEFFRKATEKQGDVGRKLVYLLNTGNLVSSTGLDLMQTSACDVCLQCSCCSVQRTCLRAVESLRAAWAHAVLCPHRALCCCCMPE
jgi:hypothetical protein